MTDPSNLPPYQAPPFQAPLHAGGSGVFITTREIYDALIIVQHHLARIDGQLTGAVALQTTVTQLEERVRKTEIWAKALPVSLVLFTITLVLAILQLNRSGGL